MGKTAEGYNAQLDEILKDIRKDLTERGMIDNNLLVWASKRLSITVRNPEQVFFGIKDGKFMILPFIDIKTVLYDQVKYYARGEVSIKPSKVRPEVVDVSFRGGSTIVYLILGNIGLSELKEIRKIYEN